MVAKVARSVASESASANSAFLRSVTSRVTVRNAVGCPAESLIKETFASTSKLTPFFLSIFELVRTAPFSKSSGIVSRICERNSGAMRSVNGFPIISSLDRWVRCNMASLQSVTFRSNPLSTMPSAIDAKVMRSVASESASANSAFLRSVMSLLISRIEETLPFSSFNRVQLLMTVTGTPSRVTWISSPSHSPLFNSLGHSASRDSGNVVCNSA